MGRILTVLAHPDDAEIWSGGAIAQQVAAGGEALICALVGDLQSPRAREAGEGAAVLGARVTLLGQEDRRVRASDEVIQAISDLLMDFRPTVVITHWEQDSHPDHAATNEATRAAVVASAGLSRTLDLVLACDTYLGAGRDGLFTPDLYVDVTDVWEQKLEAIRQHASQDPDNYVETIERQCWLHGARAKVRYAEGYRRIPLYGRLGGAVRQLGRP